jgi:outer membrane protein assembly factor BamE (lipoprotein component of BamABCDE complex)
MVLRKRGVTILIAMLVSATALSACAPRIAQRGNLPREDQLSKIVIGKQTRRDVAKILGTPSTQGVFDDKIWYYISRKTEKYAFFDPKVVDEQVVAIYFNDQNVVQAIYRYDKDDLRKVGMIDRVTPTAGKELSILEQLLGNLGRFGPPKGNNAAEE